MGKEIVNTCVLEKDALNYNTQSHNTQENLHKHKYFSKS